MKKSTRRPKITLVEVKKKKKIDMTIKGVIESMTIDRVEWRKLSYWESIADPKILGVRLCLFFIGKGNFIKRK